MKTKEISIEEAIAYCEKQEGYFYDKKALEIQPRKLEKHAVAFANSDGGELVIGIVDDSDEQDALKRWNGASDMEDFNGIIQSLINLSPSINFKYNFLKCVKLNGLVLILTIEKGNQVHKTSDDCVYVRSNASSMQVKDPSKIQELAFAKGTSSYEDELVKSTQLEKVVESNAIKYFLEQIPTKSDSLDYVVNENLTNIKDFYPRVAGILLFSDNPSANLPRKCAVKIARYETRDDNPERDHLKDSYTLEGPLYNLIYDSVAKVAEIMSGIQIWTVDGLKSVNYPPEAVHEIIANAIIHRDYSISDDVQIKLFNDRIEVLSPGRLPGYITVENILDSRFSRNTKIVRTLNRYNKAPNKDMGEGLNTAFQKMKEWRLKSPQIMEEENFVRVIIPHTSLASPEQTVLEFLDKNDMIQNRQARELTGIRSENTMKNVFYKLRDEGLIERVPHLDGPNSAWRKTQ
ncbi:ATP-binding protein [Paenibacillus sp. 1001270B_150601_E10]|uniref:ATP-binding protein n=1 Tax=Paenibacillus sp. 1001270B_150601_E10 TaxID=2787079 RepID=UPI00189E9AB8|nr:ATP-binding protein [Paenibacillus sp. 1001270B_150601_E10]